MEGCVNLFPFLRPIRSAPVARERLQTLLEYDRQSGQTELIPVLHAEIFDAISRHIRIDPDKVQVRIKRGAMALTLALDIEIPSTRASATVRA